MDMGPGYAKSARKHAPQAVICIDPYHVVALANQALDEVRRSYWNELRQIGDQNAAKRFKDARWSLLKAPKNLTDKQVGPAAEELFDRIMQMPDNAGATDEHRVLNYLAMRYPAIYAKAAEQYGGDYSMTGVEVIPSSLSSTRKIYEAIFSYTHRNTDFVEKFFVRVDVTEEFPFLVTKMSSYYDR